jgi:hypothetical protein
MDTGFNAMRQLVEQLEQLGFYKHTDLRLLADVKAEVIKADHPYREYRPYRNYDEQEEQEPLKRIYWIDLEDINEGGVKEVLLGIQPFLQAEGVKISEIEEEFQSGINTIHFVKIDGVTYPMLKQTEDGFYEVTIDL